MPSHSGYTQLRPLSSAKDEVPASPRQYLKDSGVTTRLGHWRWILAASTFLLGCVVSGLITYALTKKTCSRHVPASFLQYNHNATVDGEALAEYPARDGYHARYFNNVDLSQESAKCGENWREAKALGCRYDVMASRWWPEDCFDDHILDEMLQDVMGQDESVIEWWEDVKHTQPVAWDRAKAGEFEVLYASHPYHVAHCLYQWRKLHWALLNHQHIDHDFFVFDHTLHCTRLILEWPRAIKYGVNGSSAAFTLTPPCTNFVL